MAPEDPAAPGAVGDDESLVARVAAGREDALALLHRRYAGLVFHLAARSLDRAAAEEIVQDVFLRVWERRTLLDPAGSLRALLYRSCRNAALNHLAHRRVERLWERSQAAAPERPAPSAEIGVRERELGDAIDAAVGALPERCRLVFLLSRDHDLSYAEIADTLELSVKTVETQMGRALRSLRRALTDFLTPA